ncbi:SRPBCC family protein [Ahrensia sp. 13_GOM-1096m]|uniref:SRPBCC family protein n=1 Tax=Ahrensia sp. 13_GOM-1096m TaxID=1380380 RepID=UPI00047C6F5C|nr:SRPBCC family protein [Ahrensia sp. 13_GOM-1096m]
MTAQRASFVYVTYIRSTAEKIFEAITKPEIARVYWGHSNVSDWTPGSKWEHVRNSDATISDIVGKVVEHDPPKRLVMTWAAASQADDADQYSRVTFDIESNKDGMVKLTVSHDELQPDSKMQSGITQGWPLVLSSMKSFLETGQGFDL